MTSFFEQRAKELIEEIENMSVEEFEQMLIEYGYTPVRKDECKNLPPGTKMGDLPLPEKK